MKQGSRALGIAESYRGETSTLAGVVTRVDRVVDGIEFGQCTVGGLDATTAISELYEKFDREDIQYVFVAGIAPAWYNIVDLQELFRRVDRPILSISFENSNGLGSAIRTEFDGAECQHRLDRYQAQPTRRAVSIEDGTIYCRSVGIDDDAAADVVRSFSPEGGRPEPLRVARLAARGADRFRETGSA